jgi:hypothetical protein
VACDALETAREVRQLGTCDDCTDDALEGYLVWLLSRVADAVRFGAGLRGVLDAGDAA